MNAGFMGCFVLSSLIRCFQSMESISSARGSLHARHPLQSSMACPIGSWRLARRISLREQPAISSWRHTLVRTRLRSCRRARRIWRPAGIRCVKAWGLAKEFDVCGVGRKCDVLTLFAMLHPMVQEFDGSWSFVGTNSELSRLTMLRRERTIGRTSANACRCKLDESRQRVDASASFINALVKADILRWSDSTLMRYAGRLSSTSRSPSSASLR